MHLKTQLERILLRLPDPSLRGYFYRSVDHSALYSIDPPDALYSLGPGRSGQRFTPNGGPPALYVADKAATAFAEGTHAITSSLTGTIVPPAPVVVYAVDVNLNHVLELTDNDVLKALGTTRAELQGPWADQVDAGADVPTHTLAEAVYNTDRSSHAL